MKHTPKQEKLLIRLLERYEAKINKPRAERWLDAQYEAHFIEFEPQEFHDTMKLWKNKGFISFNLGNKRRAEDGSQYDLNGKSYYVLISDSGIALAKKTRDDQENRARRMFLPARQVLFGVVALIFSTVVSNYIGDRMNQTPNKQVEAIHGIVEELKEIRKTIQATTQPQVEQ